MGSFLVTAHGIFNLQPMRSSSLTRNQTQAPALRPPGKSPRAYLLDTTWKRQCLLFCFTTSRDLRRRRQWHPTPVLLPGKSHGQRRLEGCSPWGHWGSDMAEWLPFHFSLSCIGEGNGNPLQCSCLENPRDGGAWWAAVYGVTQSGHDRSDLAAAET